MKIKLGQILLSVLFAILISCNGKKEPEFNLLTLNINNEIDGVLNSINEREVQNILNNFQNNETDEFINNTLHNNTLANSDEIIEQIKDNTEQGEYNCYKSILRNHTCPILLSDFLDNDIISLSKNPLYKFYILSFI